MVSQLYDKLCTTEFNKPRRYYSKRTNAKKKKKTNNSLFQNFLLCIKQNCKEEKNGKCVPGRTHHLTVLSALKKINDVLKIN